MRLRLAPSPIVATVRGDKPPRGRLGDVAEDALTPYQNASSSGGMSSAWHTQVSP